MNPLVDEPAVSLFAREHEEPELLAEQIVLAANGWALECIAARHGPGV